MFSNSGAEPYYNDKGWELALSVIAAVHPHKLGDTSFRIYNVIFPIYSGRSKFHPSYKEHCCALTTKTLFTLVYTLNVLNIRQTLLMLTCSVFYII